MIASNQRGGKTPYAHQLEAAQYLANGGFYLYMEPRTGKTLSTILAAEAVLEPGQQMLILAPKSVLPVWRDELAERGHDSVIISGTPAAKFKKLGIHTHHIITYESSWRSIHNLNDYSVVVLDEAIKLQNGNTRVGKHWAGITTMRPGIKIWALSGAPCPEGPIQLANQMIVCLGRWFGYSRYSSYLWAHWDWDDVRFKYKIKDPRHPKEATELFSSKAFVISQKDLNMAPKVFETRKIAASRVEEKLLLDNKAKGVSNNPMQNDDAVIAAYAHAASSGIDATTKEIIKNPSKLKAVVEAAFDYLDLDPQNQVVVMHRYLATGKWLAEALNCEHIDGKTSDTNRDLYVKQYQSGDARVLVGQADAVKMGLDFSANGFGMLIYAEHSWSGDTFIQGTQRVVNTERTTPALILTFCLMYKSGYSVDANVYKAVKNKQNFNAKLLED